jgi:ribose transport system substrate-binding protein
MKDENNIKKDTKDINQRLVSFFLAKISACGKISYVERKRWSIMKKRIIAIGLCVIFLLLLMIGCSSKQPSQSNDTKNNKKVIAVSVITETHNWPVRVRHFAEEEVKKVAKENDWEYKLVVGNDANEQSNQVIELVNEGVDCIIMLPMDGASLKTAAMSVQAAGIPLVIFDREIPDFAPTATVKGDNTAIGSLTADIFNGIFPDGGTVLELMGDTSTVPQQRTDGFDEKINDNFKKIQVGYTGWQREDTKHLFEDWVSGHSKEELNEIEAIFAHDDEIALGVLDALEDEVNEKALPHLKVVAGSAGDMEMYERIREDDRYDLISITYPASMIKEAIRTGEKIIKGEEYEEMMIMPLDIVDKKNVSEFEEK